MYQKTVNAMISIHHFYDLNIPKADGVISHLYNMQLWRVVISTRQGVRMRPKYALHECHSLSDSYKYTKPSTFRVFV